MSAELAAKAERLRALHVQGKPVVLPNAWDVASARHFARQGIAALATTSAGVANALGFPDGEAIPPRQADAYRLEVASPSGFDLVFSVGTTSVFPYIAAPVLDAHHLGRPSVEINPGGTDVSEFVTVKLPLGAAAALDAIWRAYKE